VSAQVSYLDKIDCDPVFGGLVTEDGVGCKTCNPGFTFVKRAGPGQEAAMKAIETAWRTRPRAGVTVENKTSWQQCRNCPDGAATCNATAVHMSPGCLACKELECMLHVVLLAIDRGVSKCTQNPNSPKSCGQLQNMFNKKNSICPKLSRSLLPSDTAFGWIQNMLLPSHLGLSKQLIYQPQTVDTIDNMEVSQFVQFSHRSHWHEQKSLRYSPLTWDVITWE